MAARKKVTKKVSKAAGRSGPNRIKRKVTRAKTSKTQSSRAALAARAAAKKSSPRTRSKTVGKKGEAAAVKAGVSVKVEEKSSAKVVKSNGSAAKLTVAAKTAAPKTAEVKNVKEVSVAKDAIRGNAKGAESAPMRSDSASATGLAETAAKAVGTAVKPAPSATVSTANSEGASKTTKTSAPKPNDRDSSGGEQKTMKNSANKHGFKLNEFVVYPAHGVGQIVSMEEQEVAGFKLELFVINFVKDKMTLRVPTSKVTGVGMRKLSDPEAARRSLEILTGRARVKRTMWSRRAQEYEAKINSGDINAIAEVVRDLFRSEAQPEQSYSERQLYEAALDRMMREIAAVQKVSETEALKVIETQLKKNQKRIAGKGEGLDGEDAGVEEAA
jgi:CarD family transcriptional regulator